MTLFGEDDCIEGYSCYLRGNLTSGIQWRPSAPLLPGMKSDKKEERAGVASPESLKGGSAH